MITIKNAPSLYRVNAVYMAHMILSQWNYQWNQSWTKEMHSEWKLVASDSLEGLIFMAENIIYEDCYGWMVKK